MTDAKDLAAALSNQKILDNLRDGLPYPYTEQDGQGFISAMLAADEDETFAFAITVDDKVIGSACAFRQENIHRRGAFLYCNGTGIHHGNRSVYGCRRCGGRGVLYEENAAHHLYRRLPLESGIFHDYTAYFEIIQLKRRGSTSCDNLGVIGVTMAMVCDWTIKAFLILMRWRSGKWKTFKVI